MLGTREEANTYSCYFVTGSKSEAAERRMQTPWPARGWPAGLHHALAGLQFGENCSRGAAVLCLATRWRLRLLDEPQARCQGRPPAGGGGKSLHCARLLWSQPGWRLRCLHGLKSVTSAYVNFTSSVLPVSCLFNAGWFLFSGIFPFFFSDQLHLLSLKILISCLKSN